MRRWKLPALGAPKAFGPRIDGKGRGGAWSRTAKVHKAVHLTCARCGRVDRLETDHIKPRVQGGTDAWTNLQSLCHECHAAKTASEQG